MTTSGITYLLNATIHPTFKVLSDHFKCKLIKTIKLSTLLFRLIGFYLIVCILVYSYTTVVDLGIQTY